MKNTIKFVKALTKVLRDADLTIADIKAFEGLVPNLGSQLAEMNAWIVGNSVAEKVVVEIPTSAPVITKEITDDPKKDDKPWETVGKGKEWHQDNRSGCWCSEFGEIFEVATGKLLQPYWDKAHYIVDIAGSENKTIAASIVARAWKITTKEHAPLSETIVIPINGDVRDLRPENLKRVPYAMAGKDDKYASNRKIRDNCMMLLKHNGDINATLNEYPVEMQTQSFTDYLRNVRDKRIDANISDRYFINVSGELSPVDPEAEGCEDIEGEDIVSFLNMSKDMHITTQLLKNKIGVAKKLTIYEEAIMVSEQNVGNPNRSEPKIRENILKKYGYNIPIASVRKIGEMVRKNDRIILAIRKAIATSSSKEV